MSAGLGVVLTPFVCHVFPAQILELSLVESQVLPLALSDLLVMDRPWVRVRASEQVELWVEKG